MLHCHVRCNTVAVQNCGCWAQLGCTDVKEAKTTNSKAFSCGKDNQVLLLQDGARAQGGNCNNGRTSLPYSPSSPDLPPSAFHIFGPLKGTLWRRRFSAGDELKHGLREEPDASTKSFTRPAYSVSRRGRKSVFMMKKTLWKNNLIFIKDVPVIDINFILIVI